MSGSLALATIRRRIGYLRGEIARLGVLEAAGVIGRGDRNRLGRLRRDLARWKIDEQAALAERAARRGAHHD